MHSRWIRALVAATVGAALFAGCGAAAPTGTPGATPASSVAASASAGGEGTLVVSIAGDPKVFNTNYTFDNYAYYTDRNVYSRLIGYDFQTSELFGDLATEWTGSSDNKTYTLKLRTGVKWHDGEPFTAEDVVWTYEDVLRAGTAAYSYSHVKNVETVTAPDPSTVVFTLKEGDATFPLNIANYYAPIVLPKHIYEGTDPTTNPANQKPIGTGPFKFVSQTIGDRVVMERNDDYYGTMANAKTLVFRVIPNRATAMAALKSGEIAYSTASPAFGDVSALEAADGITVEKTISNILQWVGFNFDNPILADPKVRQAIGAAIDTEQVNDQAYFGLATPSKAAYLSYSWAFDPTALQPTHDVAAANRLLDEAGYPAGADGTRFELSFVAFNASIYGGPEAAQVVVQQLGQVGIKATIDLIDVAVLNQQVFKDRKFDLVTIAGLHGPNPQAFAGFVGTGGALNPMPYSNAEVDGLFAAARATSNLDAQKKAYADIQQIVIRDLPRVNLVEYQYLRPYRSELTGWWWQDGSGDRGIGWDMYNGVVVP